MAFNLISCSKYLQIILRLLIPIFFYFLSNYLKQRIIMNYIIINLIEFITILLSMTYIFYTSFQKICNKNIVIMKSLYYALLLLFICNLLMLIYPCKEYMSIFHLNILYSLLMFIIFNIIHIIINLNAKKMCNPKYNVIGIIILIILHIGLIYIKYN